MALDGAFLYCLRRELAAALLGARVDKVQQPTRDELLLSMSSRAGAHKLYFSLRPGAARVQLTAAAFENPAAPPNFCMLLRKHLTGAKLTAITQDGLERVLNFEFAATDELGDPVPLILIAEFLRTPNLILIHNNKIVDVLRRVDFADSPARPLLPGLPYSPPPPMPGKVDFLRAVNGDMSFDSLLNVVSLSASPSAAPTTAVSLSPDHIRGLSPLLLRELAAAGPILLRRALDAPAPTLITDDTGAPKNFTFLPVSHLPIAYQESYDTFSALLTAFYSRRDADDARKRRTAELSRAVARATDRTARKLNAQRGDLARGERRGDWRLYGDLLTAQLHRVPRGAAIATLDNYFDENGGTIEIPLDPALSPAANAQKYYKLYRKAQTAEKILTQQLAAGEEELRYLESVADALSRADSAAAAAALRDELTAAGYLRAPAAKGKPRKPPAALPPLRFVSDDGFTILVGRNNLQNDALTLHTAHGSDIWLHTKNISGSHTIVLTNGLTIDAIPTRTLTQAAVLAALHSSAAASQQVPVDYAPARFVRKPGGARPGKVVYTDYKTLYVTPDPALADRLREE